MNARRALDLTLLALALLLGCSVLIDPRDEPARCVMSDAGEKDVCPQGLQCRDGRCLTACNTDVPDVCNDGIDNDCDGKIDEVDPLGRDTCGDHIDNDCDGIVDEGSDGDGDGYSWCGDTVGTSGMRTPPDCDDSLVSVHPGAPEICDGRDDDCDGIIDEVQADSMLCPTGSSCIGQRCVSANCTTVAEGIAACAANQRCDATSGQCVSQQCNDSTCAADEYCDTTSMTCRPRTPQVNGAPCAEDADCASGLCIDAAALRLASGTRVCGHACCNDAQCDSTERCFASGTGARSCLPSEFVPDKTPETCTTTDVCTASTDVCSLSQDTQLTGPTFVQRANVISSTCRTNLGIGLASGQRCQSYPECATFTCVPDYPFGSVCSNPCGSSNDCMGLAQADIADNPTSLGAYCRYTDVTIDNSPVDYAAICVIRRPGDTGAGVYGAECSSPSDCQEAGCVGASANTKGRCTPPCCSDAQCGPREDGKAILCRPFAFGADGDSGARYEMRCDI